MERRGGGGGGQVKNGGGTEEGSEDVEEVESQDGHSLPRLMTPHGSARQSRE